MRKMLRESDPYLNLAPLIKNSWNPGHAFFRKVFHDLNDKMQPFIYNGFLPGCIRIIIEHIDDPDFGVEILCKKLAMSHSSLYKKIKMISGVSINAFIRSVRLGYASEMLIHSSCNVNEVAFSTGFNDIKYFRKQFKNIYRMTPSAYKKKYTSTVDDALFLKKERFSMLYYLDRH